MRLMHFMRREDSGLARTTIELCKYEERAGHDVMLRAPVSTDVLYGNPMDDPDIYSIHSQFDPERYYDKLPTFMWMHGEPLSSTANGVSMKAISDLAPICDAFICMRKEEHAIWNSIKRTYYVPKGVDLERYRPLDKVDKLSGEPAVLYYENWRGQRNPLYLCIAMQAVYKKFPKARLHLYNSRDKKLHETFVALNEVTKWSTTFLKTIHSGVPDVNLLLNRADIVVSCLSPLYARGIEAFAAGRAFIGPGYKEHDYPYTCELEPGSMADAIIKCWESYDKINYRKWAETHHDVAETVRQSVDIYKRYL